MKIRNHKLEGVEFQKARWIGGIITPEIVILHDTAGRLDKGNSAAYLRDNDAGVSVHFVIERDGTTVQQVPTNRRAGHAGKSSYNGQPDCNGFSIGIEIVNAGKMVRIPDEGGLKARAWWKEAFQDGIDVELVEVTTREHGPGVWMDYTPEQITAVTLLLETLFRDVPTLTDVTTHWYVSPGRKVDTNPLFPLEQIRAKVLGHYDPATDADNASVEVTGMVTVRAASGLNLRRWPSFNPNVILSIPDGAKVPVLRRGEFAGREWLCVVYAGQEGWIVKSFTEPEN